MIINVNTLNPDGNITQRSFNSEDGLNFENPAVQAIVILLACYDKVTVTSTKTNHQHTYYQ